MDDEAKKFMRELMGEFCVDIKGSIGDLSTKVDAIQAWKPELEARVSDLREAVGALQRAAPTYQPHVIIDIPEGAGKAAEKAKAVAPVAQGGGGCLGLGFHGRGQQPCLPGHGVSAV